MIPAPGQGIIGIASMKKNEKIASIIKELNCEETMVCAEIERNFLRTIQAGCSAPVGAYAYIKNKKIHFKTGIFSVEGKEACLLYTSPSPRDRTRSRMPSSA